MRIRGRFVVNGMVQGVCFRAATREKARNLALTGWVRNRADGAVEALAEGERDDVESLGDWCRHGPAYACVTELKETFTAATGEFDSFQIVF